MKLFFVGAELFFLLFGVNYEQQGLFPHEIMQCLRARLAHLMASIKELLIYDMIKIN